MTGQDLLLNRNFTLAELRAALATAIGVAETSISMVHSVEECLGLPDRPILAEVIELKGEFTTRLALYLHPTAAPSNDEVVSRLASLLEAKILATDGSVNPYTMRLFEAGQLPRSVAFDVYSLDELDEFIRSDSSHQGKGCKDRQNLCKDRQNLCTESAESLHRVGKFWGANDDAPLAGA